MPDFQFDDYIEPVTLTIGESKYRAMPAIPATRLKEFMDLFAQIPPLIAILSKKADGEEGAEVEPDPDGRSDAEVKLAAYTQFIQVSLDGLDFVLLDEDAQALRERAADKEHPIAAALLANIFSTLAVHYMSGGAESKEKQGEGPTDDGNELLPSSDTTGGSSEANSSTESAPENSEAGTTTS